MFFLKSRGFKSNWGTAKRKKIKKTQAYKIYEELS